jgi:AraC-like DNA-binding protein
MIPEDFRKLQSVVTPAAELESTLGGVTLAGTIRRNRGVPFDAMRVLGRYALVLLTAGQGQYLGKPGRRTAVGSGDLIVVLPDAPHAYGPGADLNWNEIYLVFDGPVFRAWHDTLAGLAPIVRGLPLLQTYLELRAIALSTDAIAQVIQLQSFFHGLLRHTRLDTTTQLPWLKQARQLLSLPPLDPAGDPKRVAQSVGVDYELFRKRFREHVGSAPGKFRDAAILRHGARLLIDPDLTLSDVAAATGYCDAFHFSRRFREVIGVSPSEYRRRARGA